jgi:hypothetical protein
MSASDAAASALSACLFEVDAARAAAGAPGGPCGRQVAALCDLVCAAEKALAALPVRLRSPNLIQICLTAPPRPSPVPVFALPMKKLLPFLVLAVAPFAAAAEAYKIAVIPKGTTHEFWKSINAGAVKAEREINAAAGREAVKIIWKGPLKEDDREQQVQVVENFIGRKVNAIVLAPLDRRALVAPVEGAIRAKIPVVVIDSGLETKAIASYVSTDNREGGRIAGRQLGKLLGGKGNVIMLRLQVGSASTEEREEALCPSPASTASLAPSHMSGRSPSAGAVGRWCLAG